MKFKYLFLVFVLLLAGCQSHSGGGNAVAQAPPPPAHSSFDGAQAFGYLTEQVAFGPRVPNSKEHEECKDYIVEQLTPYVDKVEEQPFTFQDDARNVDLKLTNIIGVINPNAQHKIVLFTHWDTRPTADQEIDEVNRRKPIPGADDGASGTATLLELAHVFHAKRPDIGVVLLFVDGEDWGPKDDKMYLGARYFAAHPGEYRPDYALLIDMIGDKGVTIHREITSEKLHPELNDKVWKIADELGYASHFPNDTKWEITDDHDTFNDHGIPAIDLIDFDYGWWHMLSDTPDKCSPDSLKVVGDVLAEVVYEEKGT